MVEDALQDRVRRIVEEFSGLDDWMARYRYLIAVGEHMLRFEERDKSEGNHIPGCEYDLWIRVDYDPDRHVLRFRADSDAKITKGLAGLLIRVVDGLPPEVVVRAEFGFLERVGLRAHLSPSRNNGLSSMIHQMKTRAREYCDGENYP